MLHDVVSFTDETDLNTSGKYPTLLNPIGSKDTDNNQLSWHVTFNIVSNVEIERTTPACLTSDVT